MYQLLARFGFYELGFLLGEPVELGFYFYCDKNFVGSCSMNPSGVAQHILFWGKERTSPV